MFVASLFSICQARPGQAAFPWAAQCRSWTELSACCIRSCVGCHRGKKGIRSSVNSQICGGPGRCRERTRAYLHSSRAGQRGLSAPSSSKALGSEPAESLTSFHFSSSTFLLASFQSEPLDQRPSFKALPLDSALLNRANLGWPHSFHTLPWGVWYEPPHPPFLLWPQHCVLLGRKIWPKRSKPASHCSSPRGEVCPRNPKCRSKPLTAALFLMLRTCVTQGAPQESPGGSC